MHLFFFWLVIGIWKVSGWKGGNMESTKISVSLRKNEQYIRKKCENCADILIRPLRLGEGPKADCLMVYIEVAVSNMMLDDSAIGKMVNHFWEISGDEIREFIDHNSLGIADVQKLETLEEAMAAMLAGNAPGQQRGARGRAHRRYAEEIIQLYAAGGQRVDIGRADFLIACTPQRPVSLIVR